MNAKKSFIMAMNGLVYEHPVPVSFNLDDKTRMSRVDGFISWIAEEYSSEIAEFFDVNRESFYDNKTCEEYWVCRSDEHIPVGMKIGKALKKYFEPYYGSDMVEAIRIEASRLIQENVVSGKLCISVHPLDYLSLSETNHNWRSCHALDGDYRSGNLSYMMDECTIIAYLKSDKEDVELPRFPEDVPWNDKKWRCLLFVDKEHDFIWAGRQYPFASESALNQVHDFLLKPFKYFNPNYRSNPFFGPELEGWISAVKKGDINVDGKIYTMGQPYLFYANAITPLSKMIKNERGSMQFNDLIHSSTYLPKFLNLSYANPSTVLYSKSMKVGGAVPCPCCGESEIAFSETMRCKECTLESDIEMDEIGYCACCGERIFYDIDYSYGENYYCRECYNEHVLTCSKCGDVFYTSSPSAYYTEDDRVLCSCCARGAR